MEILRFIFSGFWIWLGFTLILFGMGDILFSFYNRFLRHRNIIKHGYPSKYCDADGDFPDNYTND